MSVYNKLIERNVITRNDDGTVSLNYQQLLEDERKQHELEKKWNEENYKTYNIIAISSFVFILIITFFIAFNLGKKNKKSDKNLL